MRRRPLGRSDLRVSVLGLGCASFGRQIAEPAAEALIHNAVDLGVNFFDTSDTYGAPPGTSETVLGRSVRHIRSDVVLATKIGFQPATGVVGGRNTRARLQAAVDGSLARLGTDYIDLYQLHFPDSQTATEETLAALAGLVDSGKVRFVGCANYPAWMLADSVWTCELNGWPSFVSCQLHYNLLHRTPEMELLPACARFGIAAVAFHPLAKGLLAGRYTEQHPVPAEAALNSRRRYLDWCTPENWATLRLLTEFAAERRLSMTDVALGFLLGQEQVGSVLIGPTTPAQLQASALSAERGPVQDHLRELDQLVPRMVPEHVRHMIGAQPTGGVSG